MRARRRCCATRSSRTASKSPRRATTARPRTTRRTKLIEKLLFATASVVALVFLDARPARGGDRRQRGDPHADGDAVRVLGLGLHAQPRVAVRADLLDRHPRRRRDRRRREHPPPSGARTRNARCVELIPGAVDEVGGPTILATLTVIAALLPMAFVSGLMGPYMSPIPINASMGMLLSLAIAFIVTPWLARLLAEIERAPRTARGAEAGSRRASARSSSACSGRCSTSAAAGATARLLGVGGRRADRDRRSRCRCSGWSC